jgi:DNA-binding transcriptional LysR family regulator
MNRNDLRRVDMNLLVMFEALMIERNLTRVGEKLFITQSTVSAALARLRDLFDDPLLIRSGRAMAHATGAAIFKELGPAMDVISAAISRARSSTRPAAATCSAWACRTTPSSACSRPCCSPARRSPGHQRGGAAGQFLLMPACWPAARSRWG